MALFTGVTDVDPLTSTVRSVFQPIVDLRTGGAVAVEALARGLPGPHELPGPHFAAAVEAGTSGVLDEACLVAALDGVRAGAAPLTVFVNVEPTTLSALAPERLAEWGALVPDGVQVVLEVTERDLLERPAELVRAVRRVREMGWGVALDDVGAEPNGLALMPFLRPDVIKLDLALVRDRTTLEAAAVVNAVRAEAERSGAFVLAEGIETEQHLERALAMGARLGQGWMFGRPGPLRTTGMTPLLVPSRSAPVAGPRPATPFLRLSADSETQRAASSLLASMTRQLERQALLLDDQTVVLANFQHAGMMTAATRRRYGSLATLTALTAVAGVEMPGEPAPGVHGSAIDPDDPLADEWVVIVVSPYFSAALAARLVGTGEDAGEQRWDYVLTHDRTRVLDAAAVLLDRVRPGSHPVAGPTAGPTTAHPVLRVAAEELPELLLRAMATAGNGIVIADARLPDLPLVYANAAFLRMTGYAEEEVLGRNCRFLQGPETDASQVQPMRRRLLAGREVQAVLLNHRRDGTPFWNELRISSVRSGSGEITHYVASQQDVTARVDRERRTTYLAYHDELTSLPNRAHVLEHLDLEMRRARRTGSSVAAVLLDLDGFKTINDRLGHAAGDAALAGAAQRLRSVIRSGDLLGRFGGDEFLVVLAGLPSAAGAGPGGGSAVDRVVDRICAQLHAALDLPVQLAGSDVRLSVSSGAAVFPRDAGEPAELVARADAAMYRNKARP